MDSETLSVFLNKNLKKSCNLIYRPHIEISDIISESCRSFGLNPTKNFRLFDAAGDELSDSDIELLNPQEPLFLSQGEDFVKECALSIYNEIRTLGQGGFGTVKLYKNKLSGEDFALKFVDYSTLINTEDVVRMYNEIGVLRGLRHSNIVKLIEAFDLGDKMCFVMEYCSGGELMEYITQCGSLPESEVHQLGAQMVDAVRYCHNSKVIHRDLKPENVLFSNETKKVIKIVDFGIAGMFSAGRNGEVSEAGSLLFTAPEVLAGRDFRAAPALDVWSLGCILYMMLTGKHPFMQKTQEATINKIVAGVWLPLPKEIPGHWKRFFLKIFKVNPEERWSMLEISSYFDKLRFGGDSSSEEESEEEVKVNADVKQNVRVANRNATMIKSKAEE